MRLFLEMNVINPAITYTTTIIIAAVSKSNLRCKDKTTTLVMIQTETAQTRLDPNLIMGSSIDENVR
jgi:hypothetical protein